MASGSSNQPKPSGNVLCGSSLTVANASKIYNFDPLSRYAVNMTVPAYRQIVNASWALTVAEDGQNLRTGLWYNTHGLNYSDDASLGFDACAFVLSPLPENTVWRGQNDTGDCWLTLSERCVDALKARASIAAMGYTGNPTTSPTANLSAGILPAICTSVGRDVFSRPDSLPKECAPFFEGDGPNFKSFQLTGHSLSGKDMVSDLRNDCTMNNRSYQYLHGWTNLGDFGRPVDNTWATVTTRVYPVLSVFMPLADWPRSNSLNYANATMACLHVDTYNPANIEPVVKLPPATSIHRPDHLSTGAKVGIAIGAAVCAVLLTAVLIWVRRRRNRLHPVGSPYGDFSTPELEERHKQPKIGTGVSVESSEQDVAGLPGDPVAFEMRTR